MELDIWCFWIGFGAGVFLILLAHDDGLTHFLKDYEGGLSFANRARTFDMMDDEDQKMCPSKLHL